MPRLGIFLLLILLVGAAVVSVTRLRFSANIYDLLPPDLPEVQGMDQLNRHFSQDSQLLITVEGGDAAQAEAAAAALTAMLLARDDLVSQVVRELPMEEVARESSGLVAWLWLNGDPTALDILGQRLSPGRSTKTIAESLTAIEDGFLNEETVIQSYDPLGLLRVPGALDSLSSAASNPMSSEDGAFQVLYVSGAGQRFLDYRQAATWLEEIRTAVAAWQSGTPAFGEIRIGFTGTPAFMATIGTRMEHDLSGSITLTTLFIALLFWLMHRRLQPLLWLIAMILLVLCLALNAGGLLFGELSVMSAGFAAILIGLAVDYGVVLYREARAVQSVAQLRRSIGPGILWAAATTAAVFLSLNLSSLPGMAQLGNLVAIGIAIGATVMLFGFSPLAVRYPPPATKQLPDTGPGRGTMRICFVVALAIPAITGLSLAMKGAPALDPEFHPFRMSNTPVFEDWNHMQSRLEGRREMTPLIMAGRSDLELRENVARAQARLRDAEQAGLITDFFLPAGLLPDQANQTHNATPLDTLQREEDRLVGELEAAGFTEEGTSLTRDVFASWKELLERSETATTAVVPTGTLAEFVLGRILSRPDAEGERAFLGAVRPTDPRGRAWIESICDETTTIASLGALGTALNQRMKGDLMRVFLPMIGILALMLAVVFRSWRDLLLSLFTLLFGAAALLVLTIWSPLDWNAFNVCGIPLLFGTGLDYAIHMIFALRRSGGNLAEARQGIGKALIFCGASTAIGFGSLAFASARGLASLGQVCAAGILINMVVAVWLLPPWWRWLHRREFPANGPCREVARS